MNDTLIQQGWECPKCGRVYSPATDMCRYCWGAEVITTTKKDFKKSDLKNGMIVECRNGEKYMVIDDMLLSANGYNYLSSYTSDLFEKTTPYLSGSDIMKVYKEINVFDLDSANNCTVVAALKSNNLQLLWERY